MQTISLINKKDENQVRIVQIRPIKLDFSDQNTSEKKLIQNDFLYKKLKAIDEICQVNDYEKLALHDKNDLSNHNIFHGISQVNNFESNIRKSNDQKSKSNWSP